MPIVINIFLQCVKAIHEGLLIQKVSSSDKEFHFQNWVILRLEELGIHYEIRGRNTYPDISIVQVPLGFEVKGLAYPGRESTYDSNSQVPTGYHNSREIFYVFGRYPKATESDNEYPVIDLVICHGDFLNANRGYVHENKHIKGFGTYGDIMIRDRKMYVCPTPFAIVEGLAGTRTMILPGDYQTDKRIVEVGTLTRTEADHLIAGYEFDLRTNEIGIRTMPNPNKGHQHIFKAYRMAGDSQKTVKMAIKHDE